MVGVSPDQDPGSPTGHIVITITRFLCLKPCCGCDTRLSLPSVQWPLAQGPTLIDS